MSGKAASKTQIMTTREGEGKTEFGDKSLPIEGTKGTEDDAAPSIPAREIIRGEDVLAHMRARGVKI